MKTAFSLTSLPHTQFHLTSATLTPITMKTATVLATLFASAAAFAPAQQTSRSTTSVAAFEGEIGTQAPLGFWDPLGLCEGADKTRFDRLRFVEVKHGRVAMLAIVGHLVTSAGIRLPGNEQVPTGIAAISKLGTEGILPIFLFCGALELAIMKDSKGTGETPSDFRNGMFKWDASEEEKREKYSIELNNGRAAQMGILGLMVHEMLPSHEPYMINAFLGYPSHFNEGFGL